VLLTTCYARLNTRYDNYKLQHGNIQQPKNTDRMQTSTIVDQPTVSWKIQQLSHAGAVHSGFPRCNKDKDCRIPTAAQAGAHHPLLILQPIGS